MTIGFYGGKFLPLHKGHLYCIDTACKECGKVVVIMFINGIEELEAIKKYPDDESLNIESRLNCLKNVCKLYDNIDGPYIVDVDQCRYSDGTENWDAETPLVRQYVPYMDKVYSSEYRYDDYFKEAYPEAEHRLVDPNREKYPISATMIRAMEVLEDREKWIVGR